MQIIDTDILVVGSGAGGLAAAITANTKGADVLVVEKSDLYGGTSATSGGGIWIPCNHLMAKHGESDTSEAAETYLKTCIGDDVSEHRIETYVREAPKMLKFMEENSEVKFVATPYADYFPDRPGGKEGYRTLDPLPFNAAKLGKEFLNMRPPHRQTIFGGFTITVNEAKKFITRAPGYQWIMMRLTLAYRFDIPFRLKTKRHRRLALGNALVGRHLYTLLKRKVPIWRNAALKSLIRKGDRVTGAMIIRDGKDVQINVRKGVILAAGGFEHNQGMRDDYLPKPTKSEWSAGNGLNTGDAIQAAQDVGAGLSLMDAAWWGPAICVPGKFPSRVMFADRALPGIYIVNAKGERFLNEAGSYDEVGRQLQAEPLNSWVVFDSRVRKKYAVGPLYPAVVHPDSKWTPALKSVVKKAGTLRELAGQMGVDADGLKKTAEHVGKYAKTGKDEDFDSGGNAYDRYYGDPSAVPNPCLAPIDKPPFYAFPVYPGDIGTKGGVDVNGYAQALDEDGKPMAGLYAIGNTASSVMGRTYPGAGSTIGPAMTFGYVAAKHALDVNE